MSEASKEKRRRKPTRRSVRALDKVAHGLITFGGLATIVSVCGVFVFLVLEAWPLFRPAALEEHQPVAAPPAIEHVLHFAVDEHRLLAWAFLPDGKLKVIHLETGEEISTRTLVDDGAKVTAASFSQFDGTFALGFQDGTVRLGEVEIVAAPVNGAALPDRFAQLRAGEREVHNGELVERNEQGDLQVYRVTAELQGPIEVASSAIDVVDHLISERQGKNREIRLAVATSEGELRAYRGRERFNLLTSEVTYDASEVVLPATESISVQGTPARLLLHGQGDVVLAAYTGGNVVAFDIRNLDAPAVQSEFDVIEDPDAELTALSPMLGRTTVVFGDSSGRVSAWFPVASEDNSKKVEWVRGHYFHDRDAPMVASLASGTRGRMLAAGFVNGEVKLYQLTTDRRIASLNVGRDAAVEQLAIAPKEDAILAITGLEIWLADLRAYHPEVTVASLFTPVWYEGYREPEHKWQSGGGEEGVEPKLGMWPLVFGTLKATLYSMLIGAPLAILAAVYTSEFLSQRARAYIKPTIEMMASLPSVVLGFLAAMIFAPIAEKIIPTAIACFAVVPATIILGSSLWTLLPQTSTLRIAAHRLWAIALAAVVGVALSYTIVGPWAEDVLFAGDLSAWLDQGRGAATGGWMLVVLPGTVLVVGLVIIRWINPWLRRVSREWPRTAKSQINLAKLLIAGVSTFALAWLISLGLSKFGFDPRGEDGFLGTYEQRNAMVVGFAMGFAIIPIIFTIADDALTAVPQHLRSGSLAAGATPWQTAVRIVIPTAMSGLFSALMIGLGRAIGETMIVLMAAGNTPVLSWNIFNGFRTLSATIAEELPEAARGSTHYRTLFLAALTLFLLTFLVNTVAEVVRLRFRRRAHLL